MAGAHPVARAGRGRRTSLNTGVRVRLAAPIALAVIGTFAVTPVFADPGTGPGPYATASCANPVGVTDVFDKTAASVTPPVLDQHWAAPNDIVEVDGHGFNQARCAVTVTIGAVSIAVAQANINTPGTSLLFTLPAYSPTSTQGASGPVTVTLAAPAGATNASNSNLHFLEQPAAAVQSASPIEGSTADVTGDGFQFGGDPQTAIGNYATCYAATGQVVSTDVAATVVSATQLSLLSPSQYCDGALNLTFTTAHYDTAAGATDDVPISVTVAAGGIDVAGQVAQVTPTSVSPGGTIDVYGTGFGPTGTASLAGTPATARWSDRAIQVVVPSGAASGQLELQRSTGDHAVLAAGVTTVLPPPPPPPTVGPGPGQTGASSTSTSGTSNPTAFSVPAGTVATSHAGVPASAVAASTQNAPAGQLTLAVTKPEDSPGTWVPFTVAVMLDGNPAANAPVSISLLSSPGTDAVVTPTSAVTDSGGLVRGTLRLSRHPGDHLLLARSGDYSDEVHFIGLRLVASSGRPLPDGLADLRFNFSGNPLVVWLSVGCFVAIILGVLVNIDVMRRFVWTVTGHQLVVWLKKRRAGSS